MDVVGSGMCMTSINFGRHVVLSYNSQTLSELVVAKAQPLGTHVIICDWHGTIRWISGDGNVPKPGDHLWRNASRESLDEMKSAFSKVVTLQDKIVIEVSNLKNKYFRLWMWPLDSAEMAVCILAMAIPVELRLLSPKERDVLNMLAQGQSPKQIAEVLDISLSSVHTHLRRSREKLNLDSIDALIGFAARFCQPGWESEEAPLATGSDSAKLPITKYSR
jgi:DNA-binding CsgD family transcriptional regulator